MKKDSYIPGIDMAKLLVMFFIASAHVLHYGLKPVAGDLHPILRPFTYDFLYTLFASMNVFAIATGFLSVKASCRYSKLIPLYLQLVFTGLVVSLVLKATGLVEITLSDLSAVFRPFACNHWWYMTCYLPVALLAPFLNEGIKALPRRALETFLVLALGIITTLDFVTKEGVNVVMRGYSTEWLLVLYVLGAYLRLYNPLAHLRARTCFLGVILIALVSASIPALAPNLPFGAAIVRYLHLFDLTSPNILALGLLTFTGFVNLRVENARVIKVVRFLAPATLGVYLIHVQPYLWYRLLRPALEETHLASVWALPFVCLALGAVIFVVCLALDLLRVQLFKVLRVGEICESLSARLAARIFKAPTQNADTNP